MTETKTIQQNKRTYRAACDIYHEEDKVVLTMEMPGVTKEDLNIRIDGNVLYIHGQKKLHHENGEYRMREIPEGDFYHEFTLDDTIDRNKVDAQLKNGVVTLVLRIKESEKPRKINVISN
ncbi:MAG: Hsp20/alpha crystallin family protein [Spirochaetales bacterium]|nr:Hsp20/alpha crystallin family protein [Spirochaetales bacterium]